MDTENYKLDEIADQAGVSPRTVRYYVQRGLLPAPAFRGKDSSYGREHLLRLRAIKRLQEQFLPLDAIAEALAGRTYPELERIADGTAPIVATQVQIPQPVPDVRTRAATWERRALAPGLELHLADDASEQTRALAEQLMKLATGHGGTTR